MNNFTQYNKKYGWEKGNDLLREFARELSIKFKKGLVFRVLGDVFLVLHNEHNADMETARFDSLGQSEVTLKFKHIDIHESDLDLNDLEILKKEN
jgi:GGDEF domain-containing protein